MYHILLCDDEEDILYALKIYLENPEYVFHEAHTGREAVRIVKEQPVELILMDIMMPELDGISAMQEIRKFSNAPIILLTAKSEDIDKIVGLNAGADDYITKPFNPMEVSARVKSQLRRYIQLGGNVAADHVLENGGIRLNEESREVYLDGQEISPKNMRCSGCLWNIRARFSRRWRSTVMSGKRKRLAVRVRFRSISGTCGRKSRSILRSRVISRSYGDKDTRWRASKRIGRYEKIMDSVTDSDRSDHDDMVWDGNRISVAEGISVHEP